MASNSNSSNQKTSDEDEVQGYIHQLSAIKTAKNEKRSSYFNCHIQTSQHHVVRAVCYSPKKRLALQQACQSKSPIKIQGVKRSLSKSFSNQNQKEEICITKYAKITTTRTDFTHDAALTSRLHQIDQCLSADVYDVVDIKIKVFSKTENKQWVIKNDKKIYKTDCLVADNTNSMKLVIWEDLIDQIHAGESYHIKNLTIRVFDDDKYLNTNESTTIEKIEDLTDINLDTVDDLKDSFITGTCIAVHITKRKACLVCNNTIDESQHDKAQREDQEDEDDDDMFTCNHCKNTLLTSNQKIKFVCNLTIKNDQNKISNYTFFNDALKSFLQIIGNDKPLNEYTEKSLERLFLKQGNQLTFIAEDSQKIIDQFLL
ncbi:uncharacterized protein LOC110236237 [Exaiptasia diaphana]|uniref:Uncharacterized protein n=1 Tax=Exaiptasia diaphana TaxID=2652724 RepID=A0A913X1E0_EXADI|nr:uncharacterized protein LOC110236237 [Exaiptasia diaphana]KXJ05367.1 hypothetical protein AC249_AIPGENE6647 [Exaiptasia diaphana]